MNYFHNSIKFYYNTMLIGYYDNVVYNDIFLMTPLFTKMGSHTKEFSDIVRIKVIMAVLNILNSVTISRRYCTVSPLFLSLVDGVLGNAFCAGACIATGAGISPHY